MDIHKIKSNDEAYLETASTGKRIIAILTVSNRDSILEEASKVLNTEDVDGIFLTTKVFLKTRILLDAAEELKLIFPKKKIGVKFSTISSILTDFVYKRTIDMVMFKDTKFEEDKHEARFPYESQAILKLLKKKGINIYENISIGNIEHLENVVNLVSDYCDVIVIGDKSTENLDRKEISRIKDLMGDVKSLAVLARIATTTEQCKSLANSYANELLVNFSKEKEKIALLLSLMQNT